MNGPDFDLGFMRFMQLYALTRDTRIMTLEYLEYFQKTVYSPAVQIVVPFKVRFFFKSFQYTEPSSYVLNNEIIKLLFHILKNMVYVYTSTLKGTAKSDSAFCDKSV